MKKYIVILIILILILSACQTEKEVAEEKSTNQTTKTTTEVITETTEAKIETTTKELEEDNLSDIPLVTSDEIEVLRSLALTWMEHFFIGEYEIILSDYKMTAEVEAVLTLDVLEQLEAGLTTQYGEFKNIIGTRYIEDSGYQIIFVNIAYGYSDLSMYFSFDEDGLIAGVNVAGYDESDMVLYDGLLSANNIEESEPKWDQSILDLEKEVVFGSTEYPLNGSLLIPENNSLNTVVIIIHGSGPNNRDGSVGPNTPYKDLAVELAKQGIGSLRFDKRTFTYGQEIADDIEFTVYEESVEDAYLATQYVKETLGDDVKVVVLGHSLGGHLIPYIHDTIIEKGLDVDKYIVMAGNARNLLDILPEQIDYLIQLDGDVTEDELLYSEQINESILALENMDTLAEDIPVLNGFKAYWKSLIDYKPLEQVVNIKEPILIIQGSRDYQVVPSEYNLWMSVMADMDNAYFALIEGVNHLMMFGEGEPNNTEYMLSSYISEEVVEAIVAFIEVE